MTTDWDYDNAPTDPTHGGKMTAEMACEYIDVLLREIAHLKRRNDSTRGHAMTDRRESHPGMEKFFWFGDTCVALHGGGRWLGWGKIVTPAGATVYACAIMGLVISVSSFHRAS